MNVTILLSWDGLVSSCVPAWIRVESVKRSLSVLFSALLILNPPIIAQVQDPWTSMNGPWEAWEPNDIAVGYAQRIAYVYTIGGANRGLLVSTNAGDAWSTLTMSEVVAVACGENQPLTIHVSRQEGSHYIMSKSIDGGLTWIDQRTFNNPVSRICIAQNNPNVVYVGLGGQQFDVDQPLWRSNDGGRTWKCITNLNIYAKVTQVSLDPEDSSIIYLAAKGTMGGIWKSTDDGRTWSSKNVGIANRQIASLAIANAPHTNVLYAGTSEPEGGDAGTIYNSTDGGDHWTSQMNTSGAADIIVDPFHPNIAYAATKNGILFTKDGGASWPKKSNGIVCKNAKRISVMRGEDQQVHWLLGTQAAFYRTDDDGEHWNEKTLGMTLVSCYRVALNRLGIFSISYGGRNTGSFLNRSDDGSKWTVLQDNTLFNPSPSTSPFYGFAVAASLIHPDLLLASGTSGGNIPQELFRSSDAGYTWMKVYSRDFANQPCNIIFDPRDDRFVYTADLDYVLKSSDGGSTWERLQNSPPDVYAIGVPAPKKSISKTIFAGGSHLVHKSEDGGLTWSFAGSGLPSPVVSLVCDPINPEIVYVGTNRHRVYRTTDGGSTWQPRREGLYGDFIQSIAISPLDRVLYACASDRYGEPTRVYRSSNQGETWRDISQGLGNVAVYDLSVDAEHNNTILAATSQGIFRFLDVWNNQTGIVEDKLGKPSTCELSQNYPNPFNPKTVITFDLPVGSGSTLVSLKVFDVLGREVASLVNDELKPGRYERVFDAAHLPTGVYYYRLERGNYTATKRMVLLK